MNLGCAKGRKREATCVLQNKTRGHHFGESSWKCVCFFNGRFSRVIFISYNPESVCSSSAESKGLSYYMHEFWMWIWLHIFIYFFLIFLYILDMDLRITETQGLPEIWKKMTACILPNCELPKWQVVERFLVWIWYLGMSVLHCTLWIHLFPCVVLAIVAQNMISSLMSLLVNDGVSEMSHYHQPKRRWHYDSAQLGWAFICDFWLCMNRAYCN